MKKISLILILVFVVTIAFTQDYKVITVKNGDTIKKIAAIHLKNPNSWSRLLRYNNLKSPRDVKPGMQLKIPYSLSSERIAKITFIVGKVEVFANGAWNKAKRGSLVKKNDKVKTGANGKATIKLDDGSNVQVSSNSEIVLSQYGFQKRGRQSNVKLNKGGMLVKVNKLTSQSRFGVSSINALAGVRGTTFMVKIDDKTKNVDLSVYAGKVEVNNNVKGDSKGKNVSVEKGQAIKVNVDKKSKKTTISKPVSIPKKIEWVE
ncbi:MAG: FecR domain-containing protein [Spirochaetota bacterium]|nr:FecR domain-containing protein [Spirochaetota bacterium]